MNPLAKFGNIIIFYGCFIHFVLDMAPQEKAQRVQV
uniref:Uncharacterized protein n=1 Tax=Acrobeloides nanus TaxID=290746 RepID=A0A914EM00_9BILA